MQNRFISKTARAVRSLAGSLTAHPVEMLIALHAYAVTCVLETGAEYPPVIAPWMRPALVAPVFFVTAYCLNVALRRGRARMAYYLWWIPYALTALWAGIARWTETTEYAVTNIGLLPLLVLSFRLRRDNGRFIDEAAHTAAAAAVGVTFAAVIQLLFWLTYQSVIYIFELDPVRHIGAYSAYFSFTVLAPAIFFAADNAGTAQGSSRTTDMLMNFIITPALLVYTAILYLYAAKILVLWSLPKGGVANMVFAFTITAVAVKALQRYVSDRRFGWFFDRFSIIALPLNLLFWVGASRRVAEYGLTEWRYYMILCGAVMTVCILLFLSRRTGRYLTVALTAFALLFCSAYIPPLRAGRVAVESQVRRAREAAAQLGIAAADGKLRLGAKSESDTLQRALHRRLYQSLDYVGRRDSVRLAEEFGITGGDDYLATLSSATESYVLQYREETDDEVEIETAGGYYYINYAGGDPDGISIEGFDRISVNAINYYDDRTDREKPTREIVIGGRSVNPDALLDSLLSRWGFSRRDMPTEEWLDRHAKEFLTYRSDSVLIVFDHMSIVTRDGEPAIESARDHFTATKH